MNEPKNKKIFITGGAGFIGSTLVGRLAENNEIVVYDNFERDSLRNKPFKEHPNLKIIEGNILDEALLTESIKGAEIVVHCAAIAGIDTVIKKPVKTMRVNLVGSANLLEAATSLENCERVVIFSTSEVFGSMAFNSSESDKASIGEAGEARWTYAVSKLAEEHFAFAYLQERGLPTTVLRPFNVYGPGQVGEGAMRIFIERALQNKDIEIHGDGTQIRAWCYVDDMVEGVIRAMTHKNAVGESFNIGNARAVTTIFGLANTVIRVLDSSSIVKFTYKDYVDVELRIPSVKKADELLQFHAKVDLEEGIRRTADSYQ